MSLYCERLNSSLQKKYFFSFSLRPFFCLKTPHQDPTWHLVITSLGCDSFSDFPCFYLVIYLLWLHYRVFGTFVPLSRCRTCAPALEAWSLELDHQGSPDFPCFWWLDSFEGRLVGYLVERPLIFSSIVLRPSQAALVVKNPPANASRCKRCGSGISPEGGHGNPLQYSCRKNLMDRGTWWATIHRVAQSQSQRKQLSIHGVVLKVRPGWWAWGGRPQGEELSQPITTRVPAVHTEDHGQWLWNFSSVSETCCFWRPSWDLIATLV